MSANLIATVVLGISALSHIFQIATSVVTAWRVRRRGANLATSHGRIAPVVVIVPIAHVDKYLREAIEALFRLDSHPAHLLFCLPHASEVERLIAEVAGHYPCVPFRVLVGRASVTVNPKLDNLEKALAEPGADWSCIVDANIVVPPDYLNRLFTAFRDDSAVVSALPLGTSIDGFWSEVEAAFLNTYQARLQLAADTLGAGFAHGKTLLFRTADLRRWGGTPALLSDVAEDAAITKLAWRDGLRVKLLDIPVPQPLGRRAFLEVWCRQIRWAQLRRQSFPGLFSVEPLSTSLLPVIAAGAAAELWGFGFLAGCLTSLTLWVAVETALAIFAGWRWGFGYALACVVRDVLAIAIWLLAWGRHRYDWRDNSVDMRHLRAPR